MLKKNRISQFACYLKWHSDLFASGFAGFSDDFVLSSRWQLAECSKSQCSHMGESLQSSCYIWETRNAFITSVTPILKLFKWNHSRLNCKELTSWQGPESWMNKFLLFQGLCDLHLLKMWAKIAFFFFKYCVLLEKQYVEEISGQMPAVLIVCRQAEPRAWTHRWRALILIWSYNHH